MYLLGLLNFYEIELLTWDLFFITAFIQRRSD